jgi:SMI1/KNR4 family protein SUKH-1/ankyrin repeat protein
MHVEIQDSYAPLRLQDIANFERELGAELPEQYREFLLSHNGGSFADEVWFANEATGAELCVDEFYGLNTEAFYGTELREVISWFQGPMSERTGERIPTDLIPIAETASDQVCLAVSGKMRGAVYWWDIDESQDEPWDNTILCATSFDSFLDGLFREMKPPDESIAGTPFAFAEIGDTAAIEQAMRTGFELDIRDQDGRTVLHHATNRERVKAAEYLIHRGADVNAVDNAGFTGLHLTTSSDVTKLLLTAGAEVNVADMNGRTPLMRAVEFCRGYIVHLLLAAGANPLLESPDGATAISLCQDKERILPMLLNAAGIEPEIEPKGDPIAEAIRRFRLLKDEEPETE